MLLSEIIDGGNRIIVFAGDEVIISWNRSLTLQAWGHVEGSSYQELSSRTLSEDSNHVPYTMAPILNEAIKAAERMYNGHLDQRYEGAYLAIGRILL